MNQDSSEIWVENKDTLSRFLYIVPAFIRLTSWCYVLSSGSWFINMKLTLKSHL